MKTLFPILLCCFATAVFGQIAVREIGEMPDRVWETSGLIFHKGKLITHNDSGGSAQLFEIDTVTMTVARSVSISNAENWDWEDIAQDDTYFYIADFGNNNGTRQNLRVYRVSKNMYDTVNAVPAEEIGFSYEDQTDFSDSGDSDWDAESLFVLNDELIILTKQWKSNNTVAYSIPKIPGNHTARKLDSFAVNGLVTAATYNESTKVLYMLGYNSLLGSFLYRVRGATPTLIFGGEVEQVETDIGFAQTEGITFTSDSTYLISSERFVDVPREINLPEDLTPAEPTAKADLILYRPFGSDQLQYQIVTDQTVLGWAIFDSMGRRVRFTDQEIVEISAIDIATLHPAVYYFSLYLGNETLSQAFAID